MAHFHGLLEEEEKFVGGLRIVPKLQHAHIFPNVFQKMTVLHLSFSVNQLPMGWNFIERKVSSVLKIVKPQYNLLDC